MAVTKRIRFEVLRRDAHTCQYCGAKAPDATLQIDHVVPVALGGDDKPGNLATACRDCNSGKASIPPDSPMVQSLSDKAAAYALGMLDRMKRLSDDIAALNDYSSQFHSTWDEWTRDGKAMPLPADYRSSLFRWMVMGVPAEAFLLAIPTAMEASNRKRMPDSAVFSYMAGVIWKMLEEREIDSSTRAGLTEEQKDAWYQAGFNEGADFQLGVMDRQDFLGRHIDGRPQVSDGINQRWSADFANFPWKEARNGIAALAGLKDAS